MIGHIVKVKSLFLSGCCITLTFDLINAHRKKARVCELNLSSQCPISIYLAHAQYCIKHHRLAN